MTDDRYSVVFAGELEPGATREGARQSLGTAFGLDDAQLDKLFSGHRMVVKRSIGLKEGLRYQSAFRKAGCRVSVEPSSGTTAEGNADRPTVEDSTSPRRAEPWAGPAAEATGLALAPIGTALEEIDDIQPPRFPDTTALSLVLGQQWSLEDCEPPIPPPTTLDAADLELIPMVDPGADRGD